MDDSFTQLFVNLANVNTVAQLPSIHVWVWIVINGELWGGELHSNEISWVRL